MFLRPVPAHTGLNPRSVIYQMIEWLTLKFKTNHYKFDSLSGQSGRGVTNCSPPFRNFIKMSCVAHGNGVIRHINLLPAYYATSTKRDIIFLN